jgi:thiol-disulfide isomerase/thioredoxin
VTTVLCATVLQIAMVMSGVATTPAAEEAASAAKATPTAKAKPAAKEAAKTKAKEEKPAPETYLAARQDTIKTGKPMVIMVSTDWCPPCQVMKKTILPRVREHGLLRKVAFARVNPDEDAELAEKITGGGPIPQLIMFRKTSKGWVRKVLIGGQSVETVEEFINDGLALDKAEKKIAKKTRVEDKSSKHG